MSAIVLISILILTLVPVTIGIYLVATSRRTGEQGPHCGGCGYNLTGSESNRCPECGSLFIEAGVRVDAHRKSRGRKWIGIVLIAGILSPLALGLLASTYAMSRARAAQAQAVRAFAQAQLAATATQPRQEAATASKPTTAPSPDPDEITP